MQWIPHDRWTRMRIRLRGCPHIRDSCIKVLAYVVVCASLCQRHIYAVLGVLLLTLFVWWGLGDGLGCDVTEIVDHVCREYRNKYVMGNLCHDLCMAKSLDIGSCDSTTDRLKSYRNGDLVSKVVKDPITVWRQERLVEGVEYAHFIQHVETLLKEELGPIDTTVLVNQLVFDFDANRDDKLNLGEAENLWRLLTQPSFLNFYLFQVYFSQASVAVPHLNGTCGGISVWHYRHLSVGKNLYRKTTPWPVSLFTSHAYRWALPTWVQRGKVMLSLVELIEEMYDKDGVRFHLCNVNGLTLYHLPNYEITVTEETMLLSSQQIRNRLSNITCHHPHDCVLTPQCQTRCDSHTQRCTGEVTQPTLSLICDIMEDYLLFDAPSLLKTSLTHLVHRCQRLSLYSQKADVSHSVIVIDLKNILWTHIQNRVK